MDKVAGKRYCLADIPRIPDDAQQEAEAAENNTRTPKGSQAVTAETIARSGAAEGWDEAAGLNEVELDPAALEERKRRLRDRFRRRQLIVQKVGGRVGTGGGGPIPEPL
jgi:hypothetical protein